MYYTIYKITNKINGKFYIGMHKTNNLDDGYMGSGRLITRAIKKYGLENFTKEILHVFDNEEDMKNKEKELVVVSENTYNLLEGGKGGFGYINHNGLQDRSNLLLGVKSEKWKESNRINTIKKHKSNKITTRFDLNRDIQTKATVAALSDESKAKRLASLKKINHQQGSKNSQYRTCWVSNGSIEKKIKLVELDLYSAMGYNRGRIGKVSGGVDEDCSR